jgi:hypothetical protein
MRRKQKKERERKNIMKPEDELKSRFFNSILFYHSHISSSYPVSLLFQNRVKLVLIALDQPMPMPRSGTGFHICEVDIG